MLVEDGLKARFCRGLLFLLALTVPLAKLPIPFFPSHGLSFSLQFFDGVACVSGLVAALFFLVKPGKAPILPLIYPLALLVSVLFSEHPELSRSPMARAVYLAGLACSVQFLLESSGESGRKSLKAGWIGGLALTCVCIVWGIVWFYLGYNTQDTNPFLFHYGTLRAGNFPRVCGPFFNANLLCNYLLVSLAWLESTRWRAFVVALACATLSPGLGPVALFFLWGFRSPSLRMLGVGLTVAAFLLTWIYPNELLHRRFHIAGPRVECWRQAAHLWIQSPLLGLGPGQASFTVTWPDPNGGTGVLSDPHSTWLSLLSQGGVLALCTVLFLFFRKLRTGDKHLVMAVVLALWLDGLTGSFEDARYIWLALGAFPKAPRKAPKC